MNIKACVAALTLISASAVYAQEEPPRVVITPAERTLVINQLLGAIDSSYVFPEIAARIKQTVRAHERAGDYAKAATADSLATLLTKDLQAVSQDQHLGISVRDLSEGEVVARPTEAQRLARAKEKSYGFGLVSRMPGNVAYVEIRSFGFWEPPAEAFADSVMSSVADANALIVDLRGNTGGNPAMVSHVISYLFDDAPIHLNTLYWRPTSKADSFFTNPHVRGKKFGGQKPVYVLTDENTFSAAEEFAYDLQTRHRAVVVGEKSGGGAHPGAGHDLGKYLNVFVPSGRAINPITNTDWEGRGVAPDVVVPPLDALGAAHNLARRAK